MVDDGQQQRHEDQKDGHAVEEHANRHQQQNQQRQHAVFTQAGVDDGRCDRVNHAQRGQRVGKDASQRDHQQDHRRQFARLAQDDEKVAHLDGPVDHHADKQAVEHRDHGRFCRREPAGAHTAQNQHRCSQTPSGFEKALPQGRARHGGFERTHLVFARHPDGGNHQREAGHHAGDHAGGKQRRHGCAGHHHRIHDEGNRRRNQDVGGCGGADHTGRKRRGVTGATHGQNHHAAHGRGIGRAGARDAAQEHGNCNGHQRQHARAAANNGDGEVDQAQRHARAVEDGAHQHKHRDRKQRVLAQTSVKVLRHGQQTEPLHVGIGQCDAGCTGQPQGRADRHAKQKHDDEGDKQQRRNHARRPRRMNRPSARPAIDTDMMGSQIVYHHCGTPIPGEVSP